MKIAIFGGSFDPPHNGHLGIIETLLKKPLFDKLLVLVAYQNPFKKQYRFEAMKRLEWMRKLISPYENVVCSDYEILQNKAVKTIESVLYFEKIYQPTKIYLVLGEDNFLQIVKWFSFKELCKKVEFLVFSRKTFFDNSDISNDLESNAGFAVCKNFADLHALKMHYFDVSFPCASSAIMQDIQGFKEQIPKTICDDVLWNMKI